MIQPEMTKFQFFAALSITVLDIRAAFTRPTIVQTNSFGFDLTKTVNLFMTVLAIHRKVNKVGSFFATLNGVMLGR